VIPADWTPHRRTSDRELVGWIRPDGDAWVAVSLLGEDLTAPGDWLQAEEVLEGTSLAWLGEVWMLGQPDGGALRVRLVELTGDHVVVQTDDLGAVEAKVRRFELPWPPPPALRPRRPGEGQELPTL
jgi:hypothetical protein